MRLSWIIVSAFALTAFSVSSASAGCSGGTCHLRASSSYSTPMQYSTPVQYNNSVPYNTSVVQSFPTSTPSQGSVVYSSDSTTFGSSVVNSPANYTVAKPVVSQSAETHSAPVVSAPAAYTMPTQTYQPAPYCPSCQLRNR